MTYEDIAGRFLTVNTAYDENMINNRNSISKIGRSAINGSMIKDLVATRIRTLRDGARIDISGNDITVYDDTTGGSGVITGDTATITFKRTDGGAGNVILQKRTGKNYDSENVFELYYDEESATNNYIFIGRRGNDTPSSKTKSDITQLFGKKIVQLSTDKGMASDVPEVFITTPEFSGTTNFTSTCSRTFILGVNSNDSLGFRYDLDGNIVSGQTGGGIVMGVSYSGGNVKIGQVIDANGIWVYNGIYPAGDAYFGLGSSSLRFTSAYLSTSVVVDGKTFVPTIGSFNTGKYYLREA